MLCRGGGGREGSQEGVTRWHHEGNRFSGGRAEEVSLRKRHVNWDLTNQQVSIRSEPEGTASGKKSAHQRLWERPGWLGCEFGHGSGTAGRQRHARFGQHGLSLRRDAADPLDVRVTVSECPGHRRFGQLAYDLGHERLGEERLKWGVLADGNCSKSSGRMTSPVEKAGGRRGRETEPKDCWIWRSGKRRRPQQRGKRRRGARQSGAKVTLGGRGMAD